MLSLGPIRDKYYDTFYALHVILVPATIIMSGLHHPPLWWWCWLALLLWGGERLWRMTNWLYLNGFLGTRFSLPPMAFTNQKHPDRSQGWELHSMFPDVEHRNFATDDSQSLSHTSYLSSSKPPLYHHARLSSTNSLLPPVRSSFSIPVGYAHAEILSGRTIRLRVVTPGRLTWAPGQHFLLCIPSLSKFASHPFTCASVCDKQKLGGDGRTIMFLIRAKNGWTKDLWTTVVGLLAHGQRHAVGEVPEGTILPTTGVLLKTWVDGPFGSPVRTNWGVYSTAVIIAGGSGASFAISVLEYICLCMAGRDGRSLGGTMGRKDSFSVQRIRFIWILRDFGELTSVRAPLKAQLVNDAHTAHLQWCASILHRCHLLVPPESLQLDLFVTNFNPPVSHNPRSSYGGSLTPSGTPDTSFTLATPAPIEVKGVALDQDDLIKAQMPDDDYVDLSYYMGDYTMNGELGHEEHPLDLTNFDGDNDDRVRGESTLNRALKKEGTIRRAITRKKKESRRTKRPSGAKFDSKGLPDLPALPEEAGLSQLPLSVRSLEDPAPPSGDAPGRYQDALRPLRLSAQPIVPPMPSQSSIDLDKSGYGDVYMGGSQHVKRMSTISLISQASSRQALMREAVEEPQLELGEQEMQDISIMAEFARPGRPKVDLILRDEVATAGGRVVVACERYILTSFPGLLRALAKVVGQRR